VREVDSKVCSVGELLLYHSSTTVYRVRISTAINYDSDKALQVRKAKWMRIHSNPDFDTGFVIIFKLNLYLSFFLLFSRISVFAIRKSKPFFTLWIRNKTKNFSPGRLACNRCGRGELLLLLLLLGYLITTYRHSSSSLVSAGIIMLICKITTFY
jgi:hypothetical protein